MKQDKENKQKQVTQSPKRAGTNTNSGKKKTLSHKNSVDVKKQSKKITQKASNLADGSSAGNKIRTMIEGILFLENKFVSAADLCEKARCSKEQAKDTIAALRDMYTKNSHALTVLERGEGYMLVIKKELVRELRDLYPSRVQQKLSRVLLETLSIIAYSQPITRAEIQALRGVNPENAIKVLVEQGLAHVIGKKQVAGTPNEYGTTAEFLRVFGLSSIKDLPKLHGHREAPFI